ncbi:anaphase promoting complex subunit 11 [Saccharomycopsis crataegensis]|uniref:Anaphase-promoting complex subunit 11 n=1 Tax=Saccharomycopsis crataegensis TaxID=43959 RepID=A0AAV5QKW1_9ASCO|nr:anaphase promoting complex subunit 11 [Saccharomycopsis crataegensis]
MKVTFKKWHAVTYWHWSVPNQDDLCGICRVSFDGTCPSCTYPGDSCPLVVGESCHHNFHMHCITKWLQTDASKGLCPMCRQDFKMVFPAGIDNAREHLGMVLGDSNNNEGGHQQTEPNPENGNQDILA